MIKIGDKEYQLVLTTRATKEIALRYGGLENLGEKLASSENFEMALNEITWLITLLANQSVMIHNLNNPNKQLDLLDEDTVDLLTCPKDLVMYKDAIMQAMFDGTSRQIESKVKKEKAL